MVTAPPASAGGLGGVEKALSVELSRSGDELLGLSVELQAFGLSEGDERWVVESLTEEDLVYLASFDDGTSAELVVADQGLLSALIEVQTLGRVTPGQPPARPPTRTDGVVAADMIDRWLVDLGVLPADVSVAQGIVRQNRVLDRRSVAITLDPRAYRAARLSLSFSGGPKPGC